MSMWDIAGNKTSGAPIPSCSTLAIQGRNIVLIIDFGTHQRIMPGLPIEMRGKGLTEAISCISRTCKYVVANDSTPCADPLRPRVTVDEGLDLQVRVSMWYNKYVGRAQTKIDFD